MISSFKETNHYSNGNIRSEIWKVHDPIVMIHRNDGPAYISYDRGGNQRSIEWIWMDMLCTFDEWIKETDGPLDVLVELKLIYGSGDNG